ncbi:MAG: DUF5345 family protein, partial [Vallitaleaceae bacterium]|nr:DUF5345 family protein [Vallitaleaceae bacterium]
EDEIHKVFDDIDQMVVQTPEITFFSKLIQEQEIKRQKRQSQQFLLFLSCALVLISLLAFSLVAYTYIFLVVQILSALVPALLLIVYFVKRRERLQ